MSNVTHLPVGDGHRVHIWLDMELAGGYAVGVLPSGEYNCLVRVHRTLPQARSYARALRVALGWPIVDETVPYLDGAA